MENFRVILEYKNLQEMFPLLANLADQIKFFHTALNFSAQMELT